MIDPYIDTILSRWETIFKAYTDFAEKHPVILLNLKEGKIYALPYNEFKATLSIRSQISLEDEYDKSIKSNKIVVFVRDDENKKMISASFSAEPVVA